MLIAKNKKGELVTALVAKKGEEFICPACENQLCLKKGKKQQAHFAHWIIDACQALSEGETAEHLAGKIWLNQQFPHSQLEVYLPHLKQRPDLLMDKMPIEFQCSTLTLQRFKERTYNYLSFQYQPWWIVGQKFIPRQQISQLQKCFCYWNQTAYLWYLDTKVQQMRVYYLISWDFNRGYQWQCQNIANSQKMGANVPLLTLNPVKSYWHEAAYKRFLRQRLFRRQQRFLRIQHFFYLHQGNMLDLPFWCYSSSRYHFFFEHELLLLRFLFLQSNSCHQWVQQLNQLEWQWDFPLVCQKTILKEIYQECLTLSGNLTRSFCR